MKRIFGCFAFAYFLSYALRAINAGIAPALVADLSLDAAALGRLTSAYLLAFACLQIPLGIWLDRWGARRTESALLLVAAAGCVVFSFAQSELALWIGRALIGAGVSGCLMAAFKGFRDWFAPNMQARLAAWMMVAGTCGVLTTTVPVQMLVQWVGWRPIFIGAAVLLVFSSGILLFVLPKTGDHSKPDSGAQLHKPASIQLVLSSPYFWRVGLLLWTFSGGFIALQSLWVGPWMTTVLGFDASASAQILFYFNFALMLAYLALGTVLPHFEAKGISLFTVAAAFNAAGLIFLAMIAWLITPVAWWLWLLVAASATVNTVMQPKVAMLFPASLAGRANGWLNLLIFAGAFAMQWGFGVVIELFKRNGFSTVASFQATLFCYVGFAAVVLGIYVIWQPKLPAQPSAVAPI